MTDIPEPEGYEMELFRVELLLWQDENSSSAVNDLMTTLENNDWLSGILLHSEKKMMIWNDDIILNYSNTTIEQSFEFFLALDTSKEQLLQEKQRLEVMLEKINQRLTEHD